jgi:hypothetical protein
MAFIIILVGLAIVLIGFWFHKRHQNLKSVCTMQTTGKVISMERRVEFHTETGSSRKRKSVSYYPVFQYLVDGKSIEKKSTVGTSRPRFTEGQDINISFNPNNSEQFYVAEDKAAARFDIYFMIFGVAVLIIGIVAIFFA